MNAAAPAMTATVSVASFIGGRLHEADRRQAQWSWTLL